MNQNLPWKYTGYRDHSLIGRRYNEILDCNNQEVANHNGILLQEQAEYIAEACSNYNKLINICEDLVEVIKKKNRLLYGAGIRENEEDTLVNITMNIIKKFKRMEREG